MIFDDKGFAKPNGATDWLDSPVIAGLAVLFDLPEASRIDMSKYFIPAEQKYVRHPDDRKLSFSRDQLSPMSAGMWCQNLQHLVSRHYVDGKDFLSPSVLGHLERCAGRKTNWCQDLVLEADVEWAIWTNPDTELNQLWSLLVIKGKTEGNWGLVRKLRDKHKDFRNNIRIYWDSWRQEKDLGEAMIKFIERS